MKEGISQKLRQVLPASFGIGVLEFNYLMEPETTGLPQLEIPLSLTHESAKDRRTEFIAGRICAHQALLEAGYTDEASLPRTQSGAPAWPPGWTGSITHKRGAAIAIATQEAQAKCIGVDLEQVMPASKHARLRDKILSQWESQNLAGLSPSTGQDHEAQTITLIFSAKEALFKCLHPRVNLFFGFDAAAVSEINWSQGSFRIQLTKDLSPEFLTGSTFAGRFCLESSAVVAAIWF